MTVGEAIKTAIAYEKKVRDVYLEACLSSQNPHGTRTMKMMAAEEQGHIDYLEHKLTEFKKTGTVTVQELDTIVPSPEIIQKEVEKLHDRVTAEDRNVVDQDSELRMLEKALEVEEETSNYYQTLVNSLTDEAQEMFAKFLEIEKGHLAIVKAEINSVSGDGFWFDFQEFNLEA